MNLEKFLLGFFDKKYTWVNICFCDKEVYSICEDQLDRGEFFRFFLKNKIWIV